MSLLKFFQKQIPVSDAEEAPASKAGESSSLVSLEESDKPSDSESVDDIDESRSVDESCIPPAAKRVPLTLWQVILVLLFLLIVSINYLLTISSQEWTISFPRVSVGELSNIVGCNYILGLFTVSRRMVGIVFHVFSLLLVCRMLETRLIHTIVSGLIL